MFVQCISLHVMNYDEYQVNLIVKIVLMFLILQRGPEDNFPSKADDFDIAVRELKFEMKGKVR